MQNKTNIKVLENVDEIIRLKKDLILDREILFGLEFTFDDYDNIMLKLIFTKVLVKDYCHSDCDCDCVGMQAYEKRGDCYVLYNKDSVIENNWIIMKKLNSMMSDLRIDNKYIEIDLYISENKTVTLRNCRFNITELLKQFVF